LNKKVISNGCFMTLWNFGPQARKLYFVDAITVHIQASSVAYIFFGRCMFLISNHRVLEIRWQMTGQVPHCITKISARIVFVTLPLYLHGIESSSIL
jgi:hypothetical protein